MAFREPLLASTTRNNVFVSRRQYKKSKKEIEILLTITEPIEPKTNRKDRT